MVLEQNLNIVDITSFTKLNSKWKTGLNVKYNILKFVEDNIAEHLDNLRFSNDFLDKTAKA